MSDIPHEDRRKLLGRKVRVTLGEEVIAEGTLLGFGEGGDCEVRDETGMVHYCWPMLDVEAIDDPHIQHRNVFEKDE